MTDSGVIAGSCATAGAGCLDYVAGRTVVEAMAICIRGNGTFSTGPCTRVGAYGFCERTIDGALVREVLYTADADGGVSVDIVQSICEGLGGTFTAL